MRIFIVGRRLDGLFLFDQLYLPASSTLFVRLPLSSDGETIDRFTPRAHLRRTRYYTRARKSFDRSIFRFRRRH